MSSSQPKILHFGLESPRISQPPLREKRRSIQREARGLFGAGELAEAVHALAEAAFANEGVGDGLDLFVEQVVGLLYEYYRHVGNGFRWPGFNKVHIVFGVVMLSAESAHGRKFFAVGLPLQMVARCKVIFIVLKEFEQARFGNIEELYLGF